MFSASPSLPRSDLTRSTTWLHPRTGEPVNSGHMIRSGGCPGPAARRPLLAPRPAGEVLTPPSRSLSLSLSPSPVPCRPAPRMGGGVLGGGRQLLHRVSTGSRPRADRPGLGGAAGAAPARPGLSPAAPAPTPHVRRAH